MAESPEEMWGQQSNVSSGHWILHQSVNQSIDQPPNQSINNTIQYNTNFIDTPWRGLFSDNDNKSIETRVNLKITKLHQQALAAPFQPAQHKKTLLFEPKTGAALIGKVKRRFA